MPLFYQHDINQFTRLAIWHIEEPEDFFRVPLQRTVSHPHKRLQHLAGRYLLRLLFPDFPLREILIADTRKPFLPQDKYHFSISHCGNFAAAIASNRQRVGIDVEQMVHTVARIRHKFLSDTEYALLQPAITAAADPLSPLTMMWSAKETVFKWYSLGKIDFKDHIRLMQPPLSQGPFQWTLDISFRKNIPLPLTVTSRQWDDLFMSFLVTD